MATKGTWCVLNQSELQQAQLKGIPGWQGVAVRGSSSSSLCTAEALVRLPGFCYNLLSHQVPSDAAVPVVHIIHK